MLPAAALLLFLAAALAACASGQPAATATLLDQLPVPTSAVLGIGRDGPGYDDGASFVTYVSQLPPDAALQGYSQQLVAAGYVRVGQDGAWRLFSRGGVQIAVSVSPSGPPSTIIVRIGGPGHGRPGAGSPPRPDAGSGTGGDPATADATPRGNSGKTPEPSGGPADNGNNPDNGNNGGTGNGNGGTGNDGGSGGNAGNNGGGIVPPPEHATPKPHPTPPPNATQPPKATPPPKGSQPPKQTSAPRDTQVARPTDRAKP